MAEPESGRVCKTSARKNPNAVGSRHWIQGQNLRMQNYRKLACENLPFLEPSSARVFVPDEI